jgi:hypothetical protein
MKPTTRKPTKAKAAPGETKPRPSPETVTALAAYARAALHGTQEELDQTRAAYQAQAAEDARKHAERTQEEQAPTTEEADRTAEHPEEEKRAA